MLLHKFVLVLLLTVLLPIGCKWKNEEVAPKEIQESPVLESIKDSSLPCFGCHSYERYSLNRRGEFSHQKHAPFEIHCNHCHILKGHKASTVDRSICNSCHKMGDFSFEASGIPVSFSHQRHANIFSCSECHPDTFNMKRGSTKITMDEIYKGESCGKCHNGKISFPSTDCSKCHSSISEFKKELSYASGGINPAIFSHSMHTAMFKCDQCHTKIFLFKKNGTGMKMDDIYQGKFCGECHNDKMAFGPMACQKCHQ